MPTYSIVLYMAYCVEEPKTKRFRSACSSLGGSATCLESNGLESCRTSSSENASRNQYGQLRLALLYKHPRDGRIKFFEDEHKYILDGTMVVPRSVTKIIDTFFDEFDARGVVQQYFTKWAGNPDSKYFSIIHNLRQKNFTDEEIQCEIIAGWSRSSQASSQAGKKLHHEIELALNGEHLENESEELRQFYDFMSEFVVPRHWEAYRTEWAIFHEETRVAGQIDCVFKNTDNDTFHMVDWKRVEKDLDVDDGLYFGRYGIGPCAHMLNNKYNKYMLQQNLYAYILRESYGIQISSMWLVQMHPCRARYTCHLLAEENIIARDLLYYEGDDCVPDLSSSKEHK